METTKTSILGSLEKTKPTETRAQLKNLVLYGLPKVGKTTVCSKLPDALIIGFENGINYVEGYKILVKNYEELKNILIELKEDKKFKFIIFDTVTTMMDILEPRAEYLFEQTIMGKNWSTKLKQEYKSILNLPKGQGYGFLKEAFIGIFDYLNNIPDKRYVWLCHSKDTLKDNSSGMELTMKDINLYNNIKTALTVKADAIGYLMRRRETLECSFVSNDDYIAGSQPEHLSNKIILLSEKDEKTGEIKSYWDKIYLELKKTK